MLPGRLPCFEGAGVKDEHKFVQVERILDRVEWDRIAQLDTLAIELMELHDELQESVDANQDSDRVIDFLITWK